MEAPQEVEAAETFHKQMWEANDLKPLIGNRFNINVTLDTSQQSDEAMKVLHNAAILAAANSPHHPTITISQSMENGAVIGGALGLSAILIAEGLKNTAAAIGNPVCAALGFVIGGLAAGAAAGAAYAKFSEINVKISPVEVALKGG